MDNTFAPPVEARVGVSLGWTVAILLSPLAELVVGFAYLAIVGRVVRAQDRQLAERR